MTSLRTIAAAAAAIALGACTLLAAPAATAVPATPREAAAIVEGWYNDFLGRTTLGDPGAQYWIDNVTYGYVNPADDLWLITHSEEYNATSVGDYYRSLLNRDPDAGSRYWVDGANARRFPLEWALQNIITSPEYLRGKTNATVVTGWYAALLGRAPSAGEIAYWSNVITARGPLGALRELYYTYEGVAARINATYQVLLDRVANGGEVGYWYAKEVESDVNVQVLVAASPEYRAWQIRQ